MPVVKKAKNSFGDYKLFEANDVAKYGFFYASGDTLKPVALKGLLYLIWTCNYKTPGEFKEVKVSMNELCGALGYRKGDTNFSRKIKNVEKNLLELMKFPVMVHDEKKKERVSFIWLKKIIIHYDTGIVEAQFDEDLGRFFGQSLKKNFTVVRLKYLNRLPSSTSITLYAYCCSMVKIGGAKISKNDLVKLLTNKDEYEYKHFKSDILLPAIETINDLTDINIEFKEVKSGRSVSDIIFDITKEPSKDEKELFIEHNNLKPDEAAAFDYDPEWKKAYEYHMETQKYEKITDVSI